MLSVASAAISIVVDVEMALGGATPEVLLMQSIVVCAHDVRMVFEG